jgi:tetratricopeptide (TPR) repeat protein
MIAKLPGRAASAVLFIAAAVIFSAAGVDPLAAQENLGRGRVTGYILDESGKPVEGAAVTLESLTSKTKLSGMSDKKGHFAVAGMGTGAWRISAVKAGFETATSDIDVKQLAANPPVTLTLKKMTGVAAFLQDKTASELFDSGSRLIEEGKVDEAIKVFEDILAKYPEIYQTHLNIGTAYLKKEDPDKAAAEFQLVLDKTVQTHGSLAKDIPTSSRALSGLGEAALKKGDLEAARKYFSQALELSPQDEVGAYNVGEILFSNQSIDEAIKYFELAISIKKSWSRPYLRLGVVYLNKGNYEKALEYLNAFVRMDPDNPEVPQARAMIAAVEKIKK